MVRVIMWICLWDPARCELNAIMEMVTLIWPNFSEYPFLHAKIKHFLLILLKSTFVKSRTFYVLINKQLLFERTVSSHCTFCFAGNVHRFESALWLHWVISSLCRPVLVQQSIIWPTDNSWLCLDQSKCLRRIHVRDHI